MLRAGKPVTSPFLNASPTVNGRVPVAPDVSWNAVTCDPLGGAGGAVAGDAAFTVKVNVVVRVTEPAVPVTVIVGEPAGVAVEVAMVNVDVQFGLHDEREKDAVAPDGNPEADRTTACAAPDTVVTVTVFVDDWPAVTAWLPPLEIEKSKLG